MTRAKCDILVTSRDHDRIMEHLFPGDGDEHGAILRAGVVRSGPSLRLLVQHVQPAEFGTDYVPGKFGYRALTPTFIHREIRQCRDSRLAYLAVHNHGSDRRVNFSRIDIESHERGYPALMDIGRGVPVGALVYGRRSVAADIWLPDGTRRSLGTYRVIGREVKRLYSQPRRERGSHPEHERQVRMFGVSGQRILEASKVAVIGLGGVGSLVTEYLARLGVGNLVLIDPEQIDESNLSRVVGATGVDVEICQLKTQIRSPPRPRDGDPYQSAAYRWRCFPRLCRATPARLRFHLLGCRLHASPACCQCDCPPVPHSDDTDGCEDTGRQVREYRRRDVRRTTCQTRYRLPLV